MKLILVAHNIRSAHNVGALMRTAEGLGVTKLYLTGYTPYPLAQNDTRLPHISQKMSKQINKTALGAEDSLDWEHKEDVDALLDELKSDGYALAALEQTNKSVSLSRYRAANRLALLLGSEVSGVDENLLSKMDTHLEIPMKGKKESFNVVEAAAIAMHHCLL